MRGYDHQYGLGTLVNHVAEGDNPLHAHITPIYQTSTFGFPDVATGRAVIQQQVPGYHYSRIASPNADQVADKIAVLEGLDLLHARPQAKPEEVVAGKLFASGMAAISGAVLGRAGAGDVLLVQRALYGNAFAFFKEEAPRLGLRVVWLEDPTPEGWLAAFDANPSATLAYAETPVNPTMMVVDLPALAEIAHQHGAWLIVDNTFATPFCQRPLSLGADVVVHSTTKYLSGHGALVGGVVVSADLEYIQKRLRTILKLYGAAPSPFDAWLTNFGLKTLELRMARHCENAFAVARYLESHPQISEVHYPGLERHPGYETACRQMSSFGGMLSFELKGGYQAGKRLMETVRLASLAVSLGNVDTLIQHPASMTHRSLTTEERDRVGLSEGLVRFSVGIENVEDILADLARALEEIDR
jgi:methionine-gamma-lyase